VEPHNYEIQLFCREPSHAEKRWNICIFTGWISADGKPHGWVPDILAPTTIKPQMLTGTRRLPFVFMDDKPGPIESEHRWPLRCEKCSLSMPVREGTARYDRVITALNELALHGVSEISLSALAAIVR
jgi:hypothetical protein